MINAICGTVYLFALGLGASASFMVGIVFAALSMWLHFAAAFLLGIILVYLAIRD